MKQDRDSPNQEEEYFYKINRDLIERKRAELDAIKKNSADQTDNPHWMMCPKCGGQMTEIELMKIKIDKCGDCLGIYFDNGELQILLESQKPRGFFGVLNKMF